MLPLSLLLYCSLIMQSFKSYLTLYPFVWHCSQSRVGFQGMLLWRHGGDDVIHGHSTDLVPPWNQYNRTNCGRQYMYIAWKWGYFHWTARHGNCKTAVLVIRIPSNYPKKNNTWDGRICTNNNYTANTVLKILQWCLYLVIWPI